MANWFGIGLCLVGAAAVAIWAAPAATSTGGTTFPGLTPSAHPAAPGDVRRAGFAGPFEATVVRVVDGDTFAARLRVWFGQEVETLVRLRGVDAPEIAGACGSERARAASARDALSALLGSGRVVLTQIGGDKYFGRVVADVSVVAVDDSFPPIDVGALLMAEGLARPYGGRARAGWCALDVAGR